MASLGHAALVANFAEMTRQTYDAFIAQEFSPQQALTLVIEVLKSASRK